MRELFIARLVELNASLSASIYRRFQRFIEWIYPRIGMGFCLIEELYFIGLPEEKI
jgi:hypothetical protein